MTALTHRHGWRSAIALMASGRGPLPRASGSGSAGVAPLGGSTWLVAQVTGGRLAQRCQYDGTHEEPTALLLFSATLLLGMAPLCTFH